MFTLSLKHKLLLVVAGLLVSTLVLVLAVPHQPLSRAHDDAGTIDLVHGNDDRNERLHIVYEIYAIEKGNIHSTLKYGISCQKCFVTKPGNPRPEYQVAAIKAKSVYRGKIVAYTILHSNIPGRVKAKQLEQKYVDKYYQINKRRPPLQLRPLPTALK